MRVIGRCVDKAAFPRAKFLCHISHALQSLLTDFCGIITVNLYSRTDSDEKWISNNYNFGMQSLAKKIWSCTWTLKAWYMVDIWTYILLYPATKSGIILYPPNHLSVRPSIRPSVHPSISASFPDLSSFWSIFFKLCMDIDIREEWFGIAHGLNWFINKNVMALDWCKNVFFLNVFRTNGWISIKFCICIGLMCI